jgi:hypothetical protein
MFIASLSAFEDSRLTTPMRVLERAQRALVVERVPVQGLLSKLIRLRNKLLTCK